MNALGVRRRDSWDHIYVQKYLIHSKGNLLHVFKSDATILVSLIPRTVQGAPEDKRLLGLCVMKRIQDSGEVL